jgi:hypothetical protein
MVWPFRFKLTPLAPIGKHVPGLDTSFANEYVPALVMGWQSVREVPDALEADPEDTETTTLLLTEPALLLATRL